MERIRTIKDLKGRGYKKATVDGVEYKVKYDPNFTRPLDVRQFDKEGKAIGLSRATRKKIFDVLEERNIERKGKEGHREPIGLSDESDDVYCSEIDDDDMPFVSFDGD